MQYVYHPTKQNPEYRSIKFIGEPKSTTSKMVGEVEMVIGGDGFDCRGYKGKFTLNFTSGFVRRGRVEITLNGRSTTMPFEISNQFYHFVETPTLSTSDRPKVTVYSTRLILSGDPFELLKLTNITRTDAYLMENTRKYLHEDEMTESHRTSFNWWKRRQLTPVSSTDVHYPL